MACRWSYPLFLGAALSVASPALAGDWSAHELGASVPLWYEYRASVNDTGTIAATQLAGTHGQAIVSESGTDITLLSGRAAADWPGSFAQDINPTGRIAGYHVGVAPTHRQASEWFKSGASWSFRDLHASVVSSSGFAAYTISAAYGVSAADVNGLYYAVGYAREAVGPTKLSKPALWTLNDASVSVQALTLPAGHAYGIAYGVSDASDSAGKRYACGGTGTAGATGFMSATCWEISAPTTPIAVAIDEVRAGGTVATSVVNRVRTVDFGAGTGAQAGPQTLAVGYFVQTDGAVVGFVKNLTTGAFDIGTALGGTYDAIVSDVTIQHYAQTARPNVPAGTVYHGAMVVGTSSTVATHTPQGTGPLSPVASMRGIAHTRVSKTPSSALATETCNLEAQLPVNALASSLEQVSGVSRSGLHMVGYAGGQLVRLENTLLAQTIALYARDAVVYHGANGGLLDTVTYHWAEVTAKRNSPDVKMIWGERAGCDVVQTGRVCAASLDGQVEAQRTRRTTGASVASDYAYIQAAEPSATSCALSPVYAVADLSLPVNPNLDTTAATENWHACGNVPAGRGGVTTGNNVDVTRDFYHCGACGNATDDGRVCTTDTCNSGTRTYTGSGNGCWIGGNSTVKGSGTCYLENERNPAATTTAYRLVNTRNDTCGNAYTTPSLRDPCSACRAASNTTGWTTLANTLCCDATGGARLDAYDRQQTHCGDAAWSYDRNDGRVRGARWKDPRPGRGSDRWTYNQDDDWSNGETCLAFGSGDPHVIHENTNAEYGSGYKRPRRIDAFFTPPVDMEDWYEAGFDDDGNGEPTPKPRARLIVRGNSGVQMQLCLYVDVARGSRGQVNIKDMRHNAGVNRTTTHDGPDNSPAFDARGQCVDTDANGVADIVVYDYDNTNNTYEDAYVHFVVRPLGDVSSFHCDQLRYTLYYGNDKLSGQSAEGGYKPAKRGCDSCCN